MSQFGGQVQTVVGALGFWGYHISVDEAVKRVTAQLNEDAKKKIVEQVASDPTIIKSVHESIVASEKKTFEDQVRTFQQQYVRIGDYYLIKSDLESSPYLDIIGLPPKFEVSANVNSERHWMLKVQK